MGGGEIRFNELRARSPQTRDRVIIRTGHMTAGDVLFKAGPLLITQNDE
jgi:hypothetical protein